LSLVVEQEELTTEEEEVQEGCELGYLI